MQILQQFRAYIPAQLKKQKKEYLIEYYAISPYTHKLERQRIRLNRMRHQYATLNEFKYQVGLLCYQINNKLAGGWSPFGITQNSRELEKLSAAVEKYLNEKRKDVRPATMRSYTNILKMFVEYTNNNLPQICVGEFSKVHAISYLDDAVETRKISNRTYNNQLKTLRAFFSWCVEKCYCHENVFVNIKPRREEEKRRTIITDEWRAKIIEWCKQNEPNYLIVCELVFNALIRPKEIRMIKIGDVHLKEKYIYIPGDNSKNHYSRNAVLSDELCKLIEPIIKDKPTNAYLIGEDYKQTTTQIGEARFRKEWDKLRKQLKLPKTMQLYSLRDTGIKTLLNNGVDALTVMQAADHHNLAITTRYANHVDEKLIEKLNKNASKF